MTGPGTTTSDSVPAALSRGEFVIKAASAKKLGYDALHHMNRTGEVPMRMKRAAKRVPPGAGRLKMQFGGGLGKQRPDEPPEIVPDEKPEPPKMPPDPGYRPRAVAPRPEGGRTTEDLDTSLWRDRKQGVVRGMTESLGRKIGFSGGGRAGLRKGYASGGKAHPGFKAVAAKIGKQPGIRNPGAVLAAASRNASAAAKKANLRLNRVK